MSKKFPKDHVPVSGLSIGGTDLIMRGLRRFPNGTIVYKVSQGEYQKAMVSKLRKDIATLEAYVSMELPIMILVEEMNGEFKQTITR